MRIFVAIEINDKNVLDSISKIQSELKINAKPVKIQNLHFTVQFLGEVSNQMVEKISRELCDLEFTPFSISFSGVGVFPKPNNPRVVWVGTNDGVNELEELVLTYRKNYCVSDLAQIKNLGHMLQYSELKIKLET